MSQIKTNASSAAIADVGASESDTPLSAMEVLVSLKETMGSMIHQAVSGIFTSMGDSVKKIEGKLDGIEKRLDEKVTGELFFLSLVSLLLIFCS